MLRTRLQKHPRTARRGNCPSCGQENVVSKNVVQRDPDHVETFIERRQRLTKIKKISQRSLGFFKQEVGR